MRSVSKLALSRSVEPSVLRVQEFCKRNGEPVRAVHVLTAVTFVLNVLMNL